MHYLVMGGIKRVVKTSKIVSLVFEEAEGLLEPGECLENKEYSRAIGELCARVLMNFKDKSFYGVETADLSAASLVYIKSAKTFKEALKLYR